MYFPEQNPEPSLGCFSPLGHSDVGQKLLLSKEIDPSNLIVQVDNGKAPKECYPQYHQECNHIIKLEGAPEIQQENVKRCSQFILPQGPVSKHSIHAQYLVLNTQILQHALLSRRTVSFVRPILQLETVVLGLSCKCSNLL